MKHLRTHNTIDQTTTLVLVVAVIVVVLRILLLLLLLFVCELEVTKMDASLVVARGDDDSFDSIHEYICIHYIIIIHLNLYFFFFVTC